MLGDDDPADNDFIRLALATIHASAIELARVKEVALASGDAETITGAVFRASGKKQLTTFMAPLAAGAAPCPVALAINAWLDRRAILHMIQVFERIGDRVPLEADAACDLVEHVSAVLGLDRTDKPVLIWPGIAAMEQMASSHLGAPIADLNAFGAWIARIADR